MRNTLPLFSKTTSPSLTASLFYLLDSRDRAQDSTAVGPLIPSCSSPTARRYQSQHKADGNVFTDTAADLSESANVKEADCCDLGNTLFHRQFGIEQNAKVAHDV